ncbi:hypothetical protein OHB54_20820 [Streptomyces sp. NBC_01007]|nr:hypothetical protein OHB54_20820 [Streptomyces sp. NBC_01007]
MNLAPVGPYGPGSVVTVNATPNGGFRFVGWEVDGVRQNVTTPSCTTTMNANHRIVALFTEIP